jgi:hypothetical protein
MEKDISLREEVVILRNRHDRSPATLEQRT